MDFESFRSGDREDSRYSCFLDSEMQHKQLSSPVAKTMLEMPVATVPSYKYYFVLEEHIFKTLLMEISQKKQLFSF